MIFSLRRYYKKRHRYYSANEKEYKKLASIAYGYKISKTNNFYLKKNVCL